MKRNTSMPWRPWIASPDSHHADAPIVRAALDAAAPNARVTGTSASLTAAHSHHRPGAARTNSIDEAFTLPIDDAISAKTATSRARPARVPVVLRTARPTSHGSAAKGSSRIESRAA